MILRYIRYGLWFIVCIVLQSTVFESLRVWGSKPDLLLIIVCLSALMRGSKNGAALGFLFGIFEDVLLGKYIGLQALTKMVTGYLMGYLKGRIFEDNIIAPMFTAAVGTFVHGFISFLVLFIMGSGISIGDYSFILSTIVFYNTLIAVIIHWRLHRPKNKDFLSSRTFNW